MDWKGLKDTTVLWGGKMSDIAKKWFQTSKEYAEKTGAWTYEKLKDSRFTLKDGYAYEKLLSEKRYAVFCIRDGDLFTKFFLPILPILFTKAWIESGSIRIVIEEWSEELRKILELDTTPSVLVRMDDGTVRRITADAEIRDFIKNFSFYDKKEKEEDEGSQEGVMDKKSTASGTSLPTEKKPVSRKKKDTSNLLEGE